MSAFDATLEDCITRSATEDQCSDEDGLRAELAELRRKAAAWDAQQHDESDADVDRRIETAIGHHLDFLAARAGVEPRAKGVTDADHREVVLAAWRARGQR